MKLTLFAYNASHYHTNLAIRALRSAVFEHPSHPEVSVLEFSLKDKRDAVLHALYLENASVYGFSCYIWNITETLQAAKSLKKLRPDCKIFVGGPEVAFRADEVLKENPFIDCVMLGDGETGVQKLISLYPSIPKKIVGERDPRFTERKPHYFLNDGTPEVLNEGKFIYYESSRGCPFSCGYCLSGADCTVIAKSAETTLDDLLMLESLPGGSRTVKFIDRTFNYDLSRAKKIWRGLLDKRYTHTYHFEIQPSVMDDEALELLSLAPKGKFQLEAGIQSTNPSVLAECGRGGDIKKELENLKRLSRIENVPLHADLICGLPTETLESVKNSINEAYPLCRELQIGFLKLLYGTRIADKAEEYGIKYRSEPPYEVLCTDALSFEDLFLLKGIAHTVDRVKNSEKFTLALGYLFALNAPSTEKTNSDGIFPAESSGITATSIFSKGQPAFEASHIYPYVTPFDFFASLSRSLGGNPAAYSQAAMYDKVYTEGLKFIKENAERERFLLLCREDFRRCERTRMPPALAKGTF